MNLPSIPKSFFNGDCFDAYRILTRGKAWLYGDLYRPAVRERFPRL